MKASTLCVAALAAALGQTTALAALPANPPLEHKTIPGVSPEPIKEGAGLRSKEDLEAFFDGVMAAHFGAQRLVGATVSVVKDGKLFFTKGYGYADLDKRTPVDPEKTLFRPGSTSKLFTWTALMQLVEQGKVDLDTDVNQYLTQFKIPATFPQPVTIRNLLTHTEGFEDGGIGYLIARNPAQATPMVDALQLHMPARVRPPTTDFSKGLNGSYSNWGTALAGLIISNVSGVPFEDYIAQNIFKPLGMEHSSFQEPLPAELAPDMATGYRYKNGAHKAGEFESIKSFGPAGSLSSTATDMAKFMIAHLQNGKYGDARILQEATARYMHQRQFAPSPYINGTGLGFYEEWIDGRRWINHGGDTVFFHSNLSLLEDEQVGIFVSYNASPVLPFSWREDLLRAFTDRYYPARLPVVKPPADFKDRMAKYAGTYQIIRHSFTKNERMFSMLGFVMQVAPTDNNTLLVSGLGGSPPSQFVEVAPNTFRNLERDDMLAFTEDGNGHVSGYDWPFPFHSVHKLKWYEGPAWHGFVVAFGVLCFVVAIVGLFRHRQADKAGVPAARRARQLAALTGLCNLVFLGLAGATFAGDTDELIYAWPPIFKVALAFPLLSIPLTLGVIWSAYRLWAGKLWTLHGRIVYSAVALGCVLFLDTLWFMNLIGYNFG